MGMAKARILYGAKFSFLVEASLKERRLNKRKMKSAIEVPLRLIPKNAQYIHMYSLIENSVAFSYFYFKNFFHTKSNFS